MLDVPRNITGISHPLINEMYMKKDYSNPRGEQNVLVIQAKAHHEEDEYDHESFDSYLVEILTDLNDLKHRAELQIGHFDRVDIRTY